MPLKRHNARRKNSPCGNTHCEPGWKCVNGGCQKNRGRFKHMARQNMKTKGGRMKRGIIKAFTSAAGAAHTIIKDTTTSKTGDFRQVEAQKAGRLISRKPMYKLKF